MMARRVHPLVAGVNEPRTFAIVPSSLAVELHVSLSLDQRPGVRCLVDQLLKSGTAVGANLEEAKAGSSRRDFVRYVEIALREARETVYWLRIYTALHLGSAEEVESLRGEGEQIARILGAIVVSAKRSF